MNAAQVLSTLRANRGVVALCVTVVLVLLGQGAISPALPLFAKGFGVGVLLIAATMAVFGVGRVLVGVPGGHLAERYGRRTVLVGSASLHALRAVLTPFSRSFAQLIVFRGFSGLGSGMFLVGTSIYLRDVSTRETRARFLSLQELSILVGMTIGPVMGGAMAGAFGIKVPFYMYGAFTVLAALIAFAAIPETLDRAKAGPARSAAESGRAETGAMSGLKGLMLHPGFLIISLFSPNPPKDGLGDSP